MVGVRSVLLVVVAASGAFGCAARGQAWVHENPHEVVASASAEPPAKVADCRAAQLPLEEEEVPFERPKTISLGLSYVEDGAGSLVIPTEESKHLFERDAYRSYGYPMGYGGYGYGRYLPAYPGSGGSRPEHRPPRDTRVPDYGPPMMDKTLPAPVWR